MYDVNRFSKFIKALITSSGISRGELPYAMGYKNTSKCLRHLDVIFQGYTGRIDKDLQVAEDLADRFSQALGCSKEDILTEIKITKNERYSQKRAIYVATFKPHIEVRTENSRPSPLLGAGVSRRIEFEDTQIPETFVDQALKLVPRGVSLWGKTIGFCIYYTPNKHVEYSVSGQKLEV